jgi:hypothetical protein
MASHAHLSHPDNFALAVFQKSGGRFSIVVGNIAEGFVPAVNEYLMDEATAAFGDVKESGSAKGSVPDRWDSFVVVGATEQQVIAFVRDKLEGSANQIRLRPVSAR